MHNVVSTGSWNSPWETDERQMTIKRASEAKNKMWAVAQKPRCYWLRQKWFLGMWAFQARRRHEMGTSCVTGQAVGEAGHTPQERASSPLWSAGRPGALWNARCFVIFQKWFSKLLRMLWNVLTKLLLRGWNDTLQFSQVQLTRWTEVELTLEPCGGKSCLILRINKGRQMHVSVSAFQLCVSMCR